MHKISDQPVVISLGRSGCAHNRPGAGRGCAGGETQQVCDRLVTKVSRLCEVPPSVSTEADPGLISA